MNIELEFKLANREKGGLDLCKQKSAVFPQHCETALSPTVTAGRRQADTQEDFESLLLEMGARDYLLELKNSEEDLKRPEGEEAEKQAQSISEVADPSLSSSSSASVLSIHSCTVQLQKLSLKEVAEPLDGPNGQRDAGDQDGESEVEMPAKTFYSFLIADHIFFSIN